MGGEREKKKIEKGKRKRKRERWVKERRGGGDGRKKD